MMISSLVDIIKAKNTKMFFLNSFSIGCKVLNI